MERRERSRRDGARAALIARGRALPRSGLKLDVDARKRRGGWYTAAPLVAWLLAWVGRGRPRRLLEPSCGDGAFFGPMAALIPSVREVVACEPEAAEAAQAVARLAVPVEVHGDFLGWMEARVGGPPEVDAVVGNPPFVRYQLLDSAWQDRAGRLLEQLGLPHTRHMNAWVPFLVGALERLRPGGRLGMVLPAELLHVLHAEAARVALRRWCRRVVVLDPSDLWFDALQGVVLLLAEKGEGPASVAVLRGGLELDPDEVAGEPLGAGKWMPALLSPAERALLADLPPTVRRFAELAEVQVGIVTGANDFFLVPEAVVEAWELGAWARPMFGRSEHVRGAVFDLADHDANRRRGLPAHFLDLQEPLSERARAYVASGEARGLHQRYKCRIREPWTAVPSVFPAPVAMLKRCHDFPRLVLNRAGALSTDTAYRVRPRGDAEALVAGFVSSLTALSAELEGRHYGGGVLELVPSEIARLRVRPGGDLSSLDAALRRGLPAPDLLAARDEALLPELGAADRHLLHAAWLRLRDRRQRS